MRYSFHPEAQDEVAEALHYYKNILPQLGFALFDEVKIVIDRLLEFPLSAPKISPRMRKAVVHRFPYSLLYSIDGEEIIVVAFMHQKRRPGYWKKRV